MLFRSQLVKSTEPGNPDLKRRNLQAIGSLMYTMLVQTSAARSGTSRASQTTPPKRRGMRSSTCSATLPYTERHEGARRAHTMCNHRLAHPGLLHTTALSLGVPAKISLAHPTPSLHPSTTKLQHNLSCRFLWFPLEKMSGLTARTSECLGAPRGRRDAASQQFTPCSPGALYFVAPTNMPPHPEKTPMQLIFCFRERWELKQRSGSGLGRQLYSERCGRNHVDICLKKSYEGRIHWMSSQA